MALTNGGEGMVMPVAPMYGGGFGGGLDGGFGWLILIVLFAMGGFGGGFGGYGGDGIFPWMNQGNMTQNGFNQAASAAQLSGIQSAVTSGFGDTALGVAGINQNICQTGSGITAAVNNGFSQNEIADNARQIANMQQSFNAQTAVTSAIGNLSSQLAQCCCDNRLATCQTQNVIQSEAAATRFADANNTRDILENCNRNNQAILDKLCALEIDAKNDKINDLQRQLTAANFDASQASQNNYLQNALTAQTQYFLSLYPPTATAVTPARVSI